MLAPRTVAIVSARNSSPEGGVISDEPQKHVLVACIDPLCVGEEFDKIPPHVTVLPPFMMRPAERQQFIERYAESAEDHLPLTILTTDFEYYGSIKVLPGFTLDWGVFTGAVCSARELGLEYPDEYSFQSYSNKDGSRALSFGTGDEVITCGGEIVYKSNHPHITDFEGVINPGEKKRFEDVQLFCYGAFTKRVKAIFRRDAYDFED